MTNQNDIKKNNKYYDDVNSSNGHIEIRGSYDDQMEDTSLM